MLDQELKSLPLVFTRVEIVPLISTPKKEPITFPTPPVRSVPPITDDAMASISNPSACCTLPDMVFKQNAAGKLVRFAKKSGEEIK